MPNKIAKHKVANDETFQAVCTKGDYYGPYETTSNAAEIDAASHTSKPGKQNHIVKIVGVRTTVRVFARKKNSSE